MNDIVIVIANMISKSDKRLMQKLKQHKKNGSKIVLLSAMFDKDILHVVNEQIHYEALCEDGVLALLAQSMCEEKNLTPLHVEYFEDLDAGYLSAESSVGEEEIEELTQKIKSAQSPLLIVADEVQNHHNEELINGFLNLIKQTSTLHVEYENLKNLQPKEIKLDKIEELSALDGTAVYMYKSGADTDKIFAPPQFLIASRMPKGGVANTTCRGKSEAKELVFCKELRGTIALMPTKNETGFAKIQIKNING